MNGRFSKQLLARLNQSHEIVQLISKHIQLKKNGNRYLGLCPFHNEKTPSFVVTPEKNMFYCFGCHEHGGPIDFHMKINQQTFPETIHQLANEAGITIERNESSDFECFDKLTKWCHNNLLNQSPILQQLKKRDIDDNCINTFKLGLMPNIQPAALCKILNCKPETLVSIGITNQLNNTNRFRQRIIFPICDAYGQVIAFGGRSIQSNQQPKYINSPETKHFKKNSVIYNKHNAKKQGYFILVEGYMDVIKLHRHGFKSAVALMGTSFNEGRIHNLVSTAQKLYICYDGDDAGQTATNKLSHMCLKYLGPDCEIFIIRLPDKHDPDSYIDAYGNEAFKKQLSGAKTLNEDMINQLAKKYPLEKTIHKSRFKQEFLKLSESINDTIFKKDFKDFGYKALYGNNTKPMQPKLQIDKDMSTWLDRVIYLIAINPSLCHELTLLETNELIALTNNQQPKLKFIGHMVNTILNENIHTIDELILKAQKKETVVKLEKLKNKDTYLPKEAHALELKASIPKLINEQKKHHAQILINKSKHSLLSTDERKILLELLKKEKNNE